ncbi:MAG: DUF5777 family beta-barrel protein [Brumimicrobium sp.]|nr:DUF5777 family beta-barrel protein [Brumimicrobium sp.]
MKKTAIFFLTALAVLTRVFTFGQEDKEFVNDDIPAKEERKYVSETFSNVHVINGHSTQTLKKREWRYIIAHRFGDALGDNGGIQTAFGFDNASDIRIGFDMGLTDNLMIGIARLKGAAQPYRSILEGFAKYRFLTQTENNEIPVSAAFTGTIYGTYMPKSENIASVTHFDRFEHRIMYASQLSISRKLHPRFSVILMPTYVHRNLVEQNDQNGLFALGGAARVRVSKSIGLIGEYFYTFSKPDLREGYKNSLGLALEWITNGHHFTFNFTNSRGFGELQYIALTEADWLEGEFRLGFTITRTFKY